MQGEFLIPIMIMLGAFAMTFGIRYLINKEKMAMIERGIDPGIGKATPRPFISLKFGLLMLGLGIGLLVALFTVRGVWGNDVPQHNEDQAVAVYFGCLSIFGGFGLIASYFVEKKWLDKEQLKP